MIRGIYTAASGMLAESLRNDAIANNLANVNTTGYKKDVAVTKSFANMLIERVNDGTPQTIGNLGTGVEVAEIAVSHEQGPATTTGNPLDLAIEGAGFFTVQTAAGVRYTRNGSFMRSSKGQLVTSDGYPVLGKNGAVALQGASAIISPDGRILIDGVEVDQLQLVDFADKKQLLKEGASLFAAPGGLIAKPATGSIQQGSREMSNVNVVAEMVNLISGYRAYELNAKSVQAHDQLLDKAVNEVGKV